MRIPSITMLYVIRKNQKGQRNKREFLVVARAREGWGKGDFSFFSSFGPAAVRKNRWGFPASGQKEKGVWGK